MTRLAPGSFAWLTRHELRLAWRGRRRGGKRQAVALALLGLYLAAGMMIAYFLMGEPIDYRAEIGVGILAASVVALSFMATQAIIGSQQTLYESRDLDLLLTAPIAGRTVLLAKLAGIAGAIALTYAGLLLPVVVPVAILGHPNLFGVVALLAALALTAAAIGIAITLTLAWIAGPRAARTVGQVAAAILGGALFLFSQLSHGGQGRRSSLAVIFEDLRAWGWGESGWSGLPGHAAFGDPLSVAILLAVGVALFAGTGAVLQRLFLTGYQDAGMRLNRTRPTGKASARLFHAGLFRPVLSKEWRLLARDPGLVFQVILRLVYLVPIMLVAFRGKGGLIAPGLAFASVLVATQLTGSFAWLAVSGEDAPDLIAVAPVHKQRIDQAKLAAALLMAAPIAALLPIAIATVGRSPLGALVSLIATAIGGTIAGYIELKLAKPGQRSAFAKRRGGSTLAGILGMLVAAIFGGGAAMIVYFIG